MVVELGCQFSLKMVLTTQLPVSGHCVLFEQLVTLVRFSVCCVIYVGVVSFYHGLRCILDMQL